ncbi:hypothetical protein HY643_05065 [Candidatus Woesearchaeota archaeon]|nr:hypothetical protein [Candidatus Woesearchaeota archaeon]
MGTMKDFLKHLIYFTIIEKLTKKVKADPEKKGDGKEEEKSNKISKGSALGCGCLTLIIGTAAATLAGAYLVNKATHYLTNINLPKFDPKIGKITKPIGKTYKTAKDLLLEPFADIKNSYNSTFHYTEKLEEALKLADKNPKYGDKDGVLGEEKELKGICKDTGLVYVQDAKIPYPSLEQYVEKYKKIK